MMKKYFGTDGIRGEFGKVLTVELAYKIGEALALLEVKNVVVGYDTRVSSPIIYDHLMQGAISKGLDVFNAGIIPTPGLIYYSKIKQYIGVIITASHNPYADNGIKVVYCGKKINAKQEKKIEDFLNGNIKIKQTNKGNIFDVNDAIKIYEKLLLKLVDIYEKRIVIDCANGATFSIAKKIFTRASFIGDNPDGYNINKKVGSTHLENIKKYIADNKFDIGFSFDGDGDRVLAVEKERVYDGDLLVYVIAIYLLNKKELKKSTVVLSIMSNIGIIKSLREKGVNVILTNVGDKYIQEEIEKNGYSLGGENSGHIITPYLNSGDGMLVALQILNIIKEKNKSLKELTEDISMYPDKMVNIKVTDKTIIEDDFLLNRVSEIKKDLGDDGKVILRASGTENLIRVSVMAKDKKILTGYLDELVGIVNYLNGGVL